MVDASLCVKQLIQGMISDQVHYTALKELLERQRQLIIARQSRELGRVNAQLIEVYQCLAQSGRQRYTLLQKLGIPTDQQGINTLFSRLPASHRSKVYALWQGLARQVSQCKAVNESNGELLGMQQEILQNLLNASEPGNWLYQQI